MRPRPDRFKAVGTDSIMEEEEEGTVATHNNNNNNNNILSNNISNNINKATVETTAINPATEAG